MNTQTAISISIDKAPSFNAARSHKRITSLNSGFTEIYSDDAIITGIKSQDMVMIKYIYKKFFHQVSVFIKSNSGSRMDAEDIFQDALVIIYKKIASGSLELISSFKTYLYSVCRHLWLKRLNMKGLSVKYDDLSVAGNFEETTGLDELSIECEKYNLFNKHFLSLSANDRKVLGLFLKKVPLSEIASIMGYKSYAYAKVRKYICKEKLKNAILNDPRYREIISLL
jgi:RNA polymerase sigma factor (sigma-70 family)